MIFREKRESEQKEGVKEAFARVKNDIFALGNELSSIKNEFFDLKNQLNFLAESINSIKIEIMHFRESRTNLKNTPFYPTDIPTEDEINPTISAIPSNNPTVPVEIRGLKYLNLDISSGNNGVPTDRQTNQQTDTYEGFSVDKEEKSSLKPLNQQIIDASKILESLDSLKKEIRLKFKQMTSQEMLVFSTIYQLEEQFPEGVEYRQIASKLRLSESSIRDYVQKITAKGISVDKIKLNNKKILLKIPSKLRNLASLETLLQLRDL